MSKADYTFKQECDVCSQKPVLRDTGMCSTCTFGERGSMWEWLDDGVTKAECKLVFPKLQRISTPDSPRSKQGTFR